MPIFRQFPLSRIPPYESQPYDLPPVLTPGPWQLYEAGGQPYEPSFGALMPPAPPQYAQGEGFDPRFIHLAQSPGRESGGPQSAPSRPRSASLLYSPELRGLYSSPQSLLGGWNPSPELLEENRQWKYLGRSREPLPERDQSFEARSNIRQEKVKLASQPRTMRDAEDAPPPREQRQLVGQPKSEAQKPPVQPHVKGQSEGSPFSKGTSIDARLAGKLGVGRGEIAPGMSFQIVRDSKGKWQVVPSLDVGVSDGNGVTFEGSHNPFTHTWGLRGKIKLPLGDR